MSERMILEKEFPLVGGKILIAIYDIDEIMAGGLFEKIYDEGLRLQKIFNFYDSESELSLLNSKRSLDVSSELVEVLHKALYYSEITDGRYDVSIGKNILLRKSGKENTALIALGCTYKDILIRENNVTLTHHDVMIDLGSIAKGYIVDKLISYMKDIGIESGFIDARGDMKVYGENAELVNVMHPRDKDKVVREILLLNGSIATSGDYHQYYGSYGNNHILGSSDIISVSVVSEDLIDADALATCLFVLGLENAKRFLLHNNYKALLIDKELVSYPFNGFGGQTYG